MSNRIDVSIAIPTYNRAYVISSAIQSCLDQKGCEKEIIIVDDGSTDNTPDVVNDFKSRFEGIKYIRIEHEGASHARNIGMQNACGEFVKFLDSDDILVKDILQEEIRIAREKSADVVYSNWATCDMDENGQEIPGTRRVIRSPDITAPLVDSVIHGRAVTVSGALYKRQHIADLSWDESLERLQDWDWFATVALKEGKFVKLDKISFLARKHQNPKISDTSMLAYAKAHHYVLDKFMRHMKLHNLFTEQRAKRMAQYYYKQLQVFCEHDDKMFQSTLEKIYQIDPKFFPFEARPHVRLLLGIFGLKYGLLLWVKVKKFFGLSKFKSK
jgi:glycosyltransferase involved in cell wall biosynthesis